MEWADDVVGRPRRANAGSRLQELLEKGLEDEEEELALQALSDAATDSTFTLGSDEEAVDDVESDFDAEEVGGVLEGEAVETEASVRRAEREARQREQQRMRQRSQRFSAAAARDRAMRLGSTAHSQKQSRRGGGGGGGADRTSRLQSTTQRGGGGGAGEDDTEDDGDDDVTGTASDLRQSVRHRPPPTIACDQRLAEARARAAALRAAQAAADSGVDGHGSGSGVATAVASGVMQTHRGLNVGKTRPRARRAPHGGGGGRSGWASPMVVGAEVAEGGRAECAPVLASRRIALYDGVCQRVAYSSGVSVLRRFGVPTIISFSIAIPPAMQS
ncbi:YL1 nuclear protein [Novymonas esmeraldas]|uniref:YL1 nuclear protein n=1 Tax=Novymonas esmeraldas TaxID=1808958 RepID=A0AAW0EJ04_9TRYP